MNSQKATIQFCGKVLVPLAAISSLLRVFLALFLVYSYILGLTLPVAWIQRYIPQMDHYSVDLVAILAPLTLLFMCFWDCVTLWGALHMRRLGSHRIAFLAVLPAIVPGFSPCMFLGIPFAWSVFQILQDPSSQQLFEKPIRKQ